uniref:Uncharacterized protein n=1 Tax=Rhizophora mucronata TaxID=61149 RepID=A0A2P2P793_RHIMU
MSWAVFAVLYHFMILIFQFSCASMFSSEIA